MIPGSAATAEGRRATRLLRAAALSLLLVSGATLAAAESPSVPVPQSPPQSPPQTPSETIPLPAGAKLRLLASPAAPVVATLAVPSEAEVLDRHRGWLRLAAGGVTGWWSPEAEAEAGTGATDTAAASRSAPSSPPPGDPVSGGDPSASAVIAAARQRMGGEARTLPFGPFHLVTDVAAEADLEALRTLAGELVELYGRRYGLAVPPEVAAWSGDGGPAVLDTASGAGTVVLFADPADYRAVVEDDGLPAQTVGGVALLAAAPEARTTRRLLAHEVGHLLNRHAFGGPPPAWLDEGLAGDLELVPSLADGRLLPGPLGRRAVRSAGDGRRYGALIALDRLHQAARRGRLETLPDLVALDAGSLRSSPRAADLYALSALWVRFLLDDRTPAGRQRSKLFRRHLRSVVDNPSSPLPPALATPDLDHAFHRWLIDLARRTEEGVGRSR